MLMTVFWFIVVLGVLVFIHELGHYLAARHVGVRVERFSIGFPPRAFGRKIGETEYVVSWVPLGGYVKLFGQNLDDEDPKDPANYAAKTKLQRLYILAAGPAFNLFAALLLMPLVYWLGVEQSGHRLEPPRIQEVRAESHAEAAGFRSGDVIISLNDAETANWKSLYENLERAVLSGGELSFVVRRTGGQGTEAQTRIAIDAMLFASGKPIGWVPLIPPRVGRPSPDMPAYQAGIREGDRVLSIDGQAVEKWQDISPLVLQGAGKAQRFTVQREGEVLSMDIAAQEADGERWLVGIYPYRYTEQHGFFESIGLGTKRLWELTTGTFSFLGQMLTGGGSLDALGGPVKIGVVIGEAARNGFVDLIFLMSVISLQLGIFNLLPIPALDGGHITLLGVEWLNRRPLSPRLRERAQTIGFSLLIALIVVVTYNDVLQLFS